MIRIITDVLWSTAIIFLLGGGIYFTIALKFPQFKFKRMIKGLTQTSNNVSPYQSLTMSLAARIGVGSLAGIALAIYIGGPGTIFWIWITSIITSVNTYCESYLALKYQEKDNNSYKGGPAYYIKNGLNNKKLAFIYALFIIISYIFGFITIQANTISKSLKSFLNINPLIVGIILSILTGYIIFKGLNKIIDITSKMVPIMGIGYLFISIIIFILNYNKVPEILNLIISSAFDIKTFGIGILSTFIIGIQRGIFSTESGLGSASIATSTSYVKDKKSLSLAQILGIYFTIFIVCTSTAFIILSSNYKILKLNNINGIELTEYALKYHLGSIGKIILLFIILSFAFSTIIAGYYYGESNMNFISPNKTKIFILKILTIILVIIGSIISSTLLWNIVDIFVASLAIINMYSLIKMRKEIINDFYKKE